MQNSHFFYFFNYKEYLYLAQYSYFYEYCYDGSNTFKCVEFSADIIKFLVLKNVYIFALFNYRRFA